MPYPKIEKQTTYSLYIILCTYLLDFALELGNLDVDIITRIIHLLMYLYIYFKRMEIKILELFFHLFHV